ncbi:programmed cell death 6-interacting protein isoform X3 [Leptonychotes weddellii]|uniref:Programmed cell death 6-interacting protein n=1 Tax=Leptonychotes weddellii TaxID=9713 RepID=A0A7F8QZA2_LEPWE|nr:programmed cell death 6-interacting protein isoform X3 [Leptonychotes weddellii]
MATFISVQLKKTSEVDLAKPLVKFIQQTYPSGGEEQAQYCRAAEELSKLRRAALGRPLDKHEGALETLLRYYDQICSIEPKFPFSENQICLTFTWKDAFDKGSLFGGSVKLALASLGYEKSCVLFNCAALASQIAAEQNLDNDEGLKIAAKHYQFASGAFLHIKETVLSALNREPTVDISPDTVGTLSLIMLAQAQEVFFLKATRDKMKDAIIAKLANQAADYFGDAFKQCQYKDTLPKYFYFQEVFPVLAAKHCIMQANAEYHQSILAKQQKKFGEEIARLQSLRLLDEEEATDNDLRAKFKERWQRTPSNDLYKPLRAEGTNFRAVLDKAVQADGQVKERYQSHRDTIALLCKPEPELNAAIPSANPAKTMQGSEVVNVLKSLLSNLDEVKKEREGLENDLKSVNFDMTSKFLTALAQDGVINEEALSVTELDRIYGGLTTKVQDSLKKQEELLRNIQVSHQEFSKMKQSNNEANLREEVLKNLATAYDNFVELVANLKEGTKFYNELTEILVRFQNKCSDIVFARKTERDELLKDLQQSIAREPSAPSIPTPAYQSSPAGGHAPAPPTPAPRTMPPAKPQPPARPPPPVLPANRAPPATAPAAVGTGTAPPTPSHAPGSAAPPPQAQGPPYPTYPGYPGYCQMPMPMGYNPYAYGQYNMPYPPVYHQSPGQAPYPGPQQPSYPFPQPPQQSYYPQQ